jgi:RNA recognition motif-containing protein
MSAINIYVGNLPFKASEDDLRELFEAFGQVDSAKIIMDQFTGKSRGFGFVEMANREEGMRAVEDLDSKDFMGRSLRVNEARPKRDNRGRDGGGGRNSRF